MYTKLASAIIFSTIWQETAPTRLVWITMLAMKNRFGEVTATVPGLAHAARVTLEECAEAIRVLSSPDPHSSDFATPTQGRRIERLADGWLVINHDKYRRLANDEEKRERDAVRQARKRERDNPKSHAVSTHAEAEAEAEADPGETPTESSSHDGARRDARRKRKSPLPPDWTPAQTPAAIELERGLDVKTELAQFKDRAMRDGATYLDWNAAWRTWLRNARKWAKPGTIASKPKPLSVTDSKLVFTKGERLP